jgi:hypothetical protein
VLTHHLTRRAVTGCVTIAAVGVAAPAQAQTVHGPPVCQGVCQLHGHMYADPSLNAYIQLAGGRPVPHTSQPGFQWGDAGIGAAGAAVLLGGAAAGVGMTRRRRLQRTVVG